MFFLKHLVPHGITPINAVSIVSSMFHVMVTLLHATEAYVAFWGIKSMIKIHALRIKARIIVCRSGQRTLHQTAYVIRECYIKSKNSDQKRKKAWNH